MTTLPPNVTQAQFNTAVRRMREVVGADWVLTSDDDVWTYRDAYTPFRGDEKAEYIPSGAVAPTEVEQVQRIVRIANEFKLPLWPFSTGRNLLYGGSAPRLSGTMMLDLKRMNRVLEVDDKRCYALVEPGVSYFDFYEHLRKNKLKVMMDCADPGWGSLIGNALDHGVGHGMYRDHFGSICGLEVVLPNGELMRTGSGAVPGSKAWQTFPYGFGPHIAPMFGQSNFGIVTKAGFFLQPEPEASRCEQIFAANFEDIHPFLDTMAALVAGNVLDASWTIESVVANSRDPDIRAAFERANGEASAELNALVRDKKLSYWRTRVYLNGAPNIIQAKLDYVKQRLSGISGIAYKAGNSYRFPEDYDTVKDGDDGDLFAQTARGIPTMSIYGLGIAAQNAAPAGAMRRRNNHGNAGFSPVIAMSGDELLRARRVFRKAFRDLNLPQVTEVGGWAWFRCNLVLLYGQDITEDAAQNAKMRDNVRTLAKIAADNGWSEYRTHTAFMDDVMAAQSFNNHALLRFHETVKDALDPNGILQPGKCGIWPKALRGRTIP